MLEFFEKNWKFLIFVIIIASFVRHSVLKERKEEERKKTRKEGQGKSKR